MKGTIAIVLAFACIFALYAETSALPADSGKDAKDTKAKEVKEPKEIKDSATASKDVKEAIKNAKETKKNKKDCAKDCGKAFEPVCAHDPTNATFKPRTFGTQCALDVHNCENGSKLVVKNKGECAGSGGVKL